ncbi:MAG: hypothetical protein K9N07_10205 [Candidatus Cloacimonetes bacterium]|nr:hypothetical protein [Candidatus Cloacimonadota bacterium]
MKKTVMIMITLFLIVVNFASGVEIRQQVNLENEFKLINESLFNSLKDYEYISNQNFNNVNFTGDKSSNRKKEILNKVISNLQEYLVLIQEENKQYIEYDFSDIHLETQKIINDDVNGIDNLCNKALTESISATTLVSGLLEVLGKMDDLDYEITLYKSIFNTINLDSYTDLKKYVSNIFLALENAQLSGNDKIDYSVFDLKELSNIEIKVDKPTFVISVLGKKYSYSIDDYTITIDENLFKIDNSSIISVQNIQGIESGKQYPYEVRSIIKKEINGYKFQKDISVQETLTIMYKINSDLEIKSIELIDAKTSEKLIISYNNKSLSSIDKVMATINKIQNKYSNFNFTSSGDSDKKQECIEILDDTQTPLVTALYKENKMIAFHSAGSTSLKDNENYYYSIKDNDNVLCFEVKYDVYNLCTPFAEEIDSILVYSENSKIYDTSVKVESKISEFQMIYYDSKPTYPQEIRSHTVQENKSLGIETELLSKTVFIKIGSKKIIYKYSNTENEYIFNRIYQ